jgi:hypothetical protein
VDDHTVLISSREVEDVTKHFVAISEPDAALVALGVVPLIGVSNEQVEVLMQVQSVSVELKLSGIR